ncbi:4956_t:CDS:2 [Funneliformis mosseae]|uniref:4956_t:CDS:1 n=1 Tax=Funneliformis mosseae TaxID=27381 RepID=A0A9N9FPX4_FUNMO|nr:4956_t:CDS:2 [Funneliformis mosseae]
MILGLRCLVPKSLSCKTRATKRRFYVGITMERRMKNSQRRVSDQSARNQVYDDTMEHLPEGFTKDALRKKTQRAMKIYSLFQKIGVDQITFTRDQNIFLLDNATSR